MACQPPCCTSIGVGTAQAHRVQQFLLLVPIVGGFAHLCFLLQIFFLSRCAVLPLADAISA